MELLRVPLGPDFRERLTCDNARAAIDEVSLVEDRREHHGRQRVAQPRRVKHHKVTPTALKQRASESQREYYTSNKAAEKMKKKGKARGRVRTSGTST